MPFHGIIIRNNTCKGGADGMSAMINARGKAILKILIQSDSYLKVDEIAQLVNISKRSIYYDIYPLTENKQKHLIHFLGLFGLVALIACIYDLIVGKSGIVVDGKITETALGIIYGLMFISVFVVYKLKKQYNAKHENDE